MRGVPTNPQLVGPITTEAELLRVRKEGTVAIDDVGKARQFRHANTHMGSGWTSYGCMPISSAELLRDGRPVWILTYDLTPNQKDES